VVISKISILVSEQQIRLLLGVYGENWIEHVPYKDVPDTLTIAHKDNQPKEGIRLWEAPDPKAVQIQLNLDLSQISLELHCSSILQEYENYQFNTYDMIVLRQLHCLDFMQTNSQLK
jgi:hypothetical protein